MAATVPGSGGGEQVLTALLVGQARFLPDVAPCIVAGGAQGCPQCQRQHGRRCDAQQPAGEHDRAWQAGHPAPLHAYCCS